MKRPKFETKVLVLEAAKTFTNISYNVTAKFAIYVNVVNGPAGCKIQNWDSIKCWFSHMLSTRLSIYLKRGDSFMYAYKNAMHRMIYEMGRAGYSDRDIAQVKFNMYCTVFSDGKTYVYYGGNDTMLLKLGTNGTPIMVSESRCLTCSDASIPTSISQSNLKEFTICTNEWAGYCIKYLRTANNLKDVHDLDYAKIQSVRTSVSKFDSACDMAYLTAEVV